ncbi:hypothetical protein GGX14DRAFT_578211 [Mycena pura]|uniref:Uncharacterized protein n=1 Tax=Mycena pura TaxID=153505 RepID=A0AAD6UQF8_9AGAR|nr:hypothetical protein GGX14DRAFT_578211 [Mycena pura]
MSPPRSPAPMYSLACGLSLAHIASGLATIFVYDIDDARGHGGDSQVIAALYSIATFYMVYMLIPHDGVGGAGDPVASLNKQFVIVNFLLLCWVLSVCLVPLTVGPELTHLIARCATEHFVSPMCVTVGLDMALPFALIATLTTISWNIYRNARAIQAAQPPPPQSPAPPPFKLRPARARREGSSSLLATA